MLVIVTGAIGIGKSTVCQKVVESARKQGLACGGVITTKGAYGGIFIEDIQSGERMPLASRFPVFTGPTAGNYYFRSQALSFGLEAIKRAASSDLLVVDEVGPLELRGEGWAAALPIIRKGLFKNALLVIRSGLVPAFSPQLGSSPLVLETTAYNRDCLPGHIGAILASLESSPLLSGVKDQPVGGHSREQQ